MRAALSILILSLTACAHAPRAPRDRLFVATVVWQKITGEAAAFSYIDPAPDEATVHAHVLAYLGEYYPVEKIVSIKVSAVEDTMISSVARQIP